MCLLEEYLRTSGPDQAIYLCPILEFSFSLAHAMRAKHGVSESHRLTSVPTSCVELVRSVFLSRYRYGCVVWFGVVEDDLTREK